MVMVVGTDAPSTTIGVANGHVQTPAIAIWLTGLWMKSECDGTRGGFISVWDVGAKCSGVGDGVGGGERVVRGGMG